ncbi:MAG: hypothetical protein WBB45_05295 [Cyclobacteriaceae bacterium]
MIHLITVSGKSASRFFLKPEYMADFSSLISSVTSERLFMISTRFRSDLFYKCETACHESVIKLWALYAGIVPTVADLCDIKILDGDEASLSGYFESLNTLSANWYQYDTYRKVFTISYSPDNPVAETIARCDKHLVKMPCIKRPSLVYDTGKARTMISLDTMKVAMHMVNDRSHAN